MSDEEQYHLPPTSIWSHISKIAITEDKPIMLDYWVDSLEKKYLLVLEKMMKNYLLKMLKNIQVLLLKFLR